MWKNQVKTILLYFVLAMPIIWLIVGIILYMRGNVGVVDWQTIFILRDNPIWSIVLLFTVSLIYWMLGNHRWKRLFRWFTGIKSLNHITQSAILLSLTFYVSLVATALLFPRLTGYAFKSDWTLLLVATVPLLALIILLLIERATSVRAKFAGVEIEFQRTITEPINQTVTLEQDLITKSSTHAIGRIIQEIKDRGKSPHSLIVRIQRNSIRVEFVALRQYVYELSKVAPLEYIVFINEDDEYLGFMSVELFKAKYPEFGIEVFLRDFQRDEGSIHDKELFHMWERVFHSPLFLELRDSWERIQNELVLPQWDAQRDKRDITERDLPRLGAIRLYLQNPTGYQAYRQMIENKVSAHIPHP